jgi:hypothetical protein
VGVKLTLVAGVLENAKPDTLDHGGALVWHLRAARAALARHESVRLNNVSGRPFASSTPTSRFASHGQIARRALNDKIETGMYTRRTVADATGSRTVVRSADISAMRDPVARISHRAKEGSQRIWGGRAVLIFGLASGMVTALITAWGSRRFQTE